MARAIASDWDDHVKSTSNLTLVRLAAQDISVHGTPGDRAWALDGAVYDAVNKLVLVNEDLFTLDQSLPYFDFTHVDRRGRRRTARAILGVVDGRFRLTIDCRHQK